MTTTLERPISFTGGFDVGARSVKVALLSHQGPKSTVLAKVVIQSGGHRDARAAMQEGWGQPLAEASLSARDVDNVASTGARAHFVERVGHFYGHSSQARGARLLFPDATVALDVGTNQIRCVLCTLGRPTEVHLVQLSAPFVDAPLPKYLATRGAMLLRSLAVEGNVVLTGGMVYNPDFVHGLWSQLLASESGVSLLISPDAIYAGAYGAAILAARRFERISRSLAPVFTEPTASGLADDKGRSLN
jgi:activator of 2-hydroxyglutaryl-CoA dehydratase